MSSNEQTNLNIPEQVFSSNLSVKNYIESLKSAQIIQKALLPRKRHFNRIFKEYFKLFIPRDIVSGDYYWTGTNNNLNYLVVGDCTGHGVPAALLSVLMLNIFEYAIMNKGIKKTHKILKEVDKKFIESFKDINNNIYDNPWSDLSIIAIDIENNKLYFSSANRKMLLVDKNLNYKIFKGNRYPIGGWQIKEKRSFDTQIIEYNNNDIIYLGSDGFQDQLGGEKNKKYKSKKLHNFLIENSKLPLMKQKNILKKEFHKWKNINTQTDDVCIVAVRL